MDKDTVFYASFVAFIILVVFGGLAIAMQGCSHAPRIAERIEIMRECGYPANPHEAKVFHDCVVKRYELGDPNP